MKKLVSLLLVLAMLLSAAAFAAEILGDRISDGLILINDGTSNKRKYGYMDTEGNIVIKGQYIGGMDFNKGLAPVQYSNGGFARWKYIDTAGNTAINNIDTGKRFYEFGQWEGDYGIVTVWEIKKNPTRIEKLAMNFINRDGKLIYDGEDLMAVMGFSEGYAMVGKGSTFGKPASYFFIDMEGNKLGSNEWASARAFSEGLAPVAVKGADGSLVWGYIDQTGNLAIAPQWQSAFAFQNGIAAVKSGELTGFIDKTGKQIIPCQYVNAGSFSEDGFATISVDDQWGIIDAEGNTVVEPCFKYAGPIVGGTSIVNDGFSYGVINTAGEYVVYPGYEYISRIGDSLYAAQEFAAPVIVNENGEVITLLLVDGAMPTEEQLAAYPDGTPCELVSAPTSNGLTLYKFFDANGNSISMNIFSEVPGTEFHIANGSGMMVLLDAEGKQIGDQKWAGINAEASTENCICVVNNNLFGYINPQGEYLIQPQFSSVGFFNNGVSMGFIGQNMTVFDENGQAILPTIRKGSDKELVKKLQQALIDQGFLDDKADGIYGGKTEAAIKAAQESFGMEVTGVADSAFQHALFK